LSNGVLWLEFGLICIDLAYGTMGEEQLKELIKMATEYLCMS
jgi:hypothetical protein